MNLTSQRIVVLSLLATNSPLTLQQIITALGHPPQFNRGEYLRVYAFVSQLVKEGLMDKKKGVRHGDMTFTLTALGKNHLGDLRAKFDRRLQAMLDIRDKLAAMQLLRPPPIPHARQVPRVASVGIPFQQSTRILCPRCGAVMPLAEAQGQLHAGAKVRCQCSYNLTPLVWGAAEGQK